MTKTNLEQIGIEPTPGPWGYSPTAGNHDFAVYSEAGGRGDVALVRDFNEANAKLIAHAWLIPQMVAQIREAMEGCGCQDGWAKANNRRECGSCESGRALLADIEL